MDTRTGEVVLDNVSTEASHHLAMSNDEKTVITFGRKVFVWNVDRMNCDDGSTKVTVSKRGELSGHDDTVTGVVSIDDSRAVTASWDQTAKIWDHFTGQELHSIRFAAGYLQEISFSAQYNRVAFVVYPTGIEILEVDNFARVIANNCGHRVFTKRRDFIVNLRPVAERAPVFQ